MPEKLLDKKASFVEKVTAKISAAVKHKITVNTGAAVIVVIVLVLALIN